MKGGYVWLASFVAFPLIGAPLAKHPAFRRLGFACRVALAGGAGMVIVSWTMTVYALTGVRWGPSLLLVSLAIAVVLRLALRSSPSSSGKRPG